MDGQRWQKEPPNKLNNMVGHYLLMRAVVRPFGLCHILKFPFSRFRPRMQPIETQLEIVAKKKLNHDCYIYDLKWAGPQFHLSIGQHFHIIETVKTHDAPEGEEVVRKYTPISPCSQQDIIELLVKIYRPNVVPAFPHGGKLTPYLEKLEVGDKIHVDGPYGRFSYKAGGVVIIDGEEMVKKRIFFIAGGTGITPCYQTIREILKMPGEDIELILLFGNRTVEDIILRKELEELAPRLKIHYIIDIGHEGWTGLTKYVTKEIMESICPLDDPDTLYCHCGPAPMNIMIRKVFSEFYPQSTIFKY